MAPQGANVPGETTATVVGWGMLSHVGPRPDILQEITFKTWSNSRCSSTYGSNAPGGITEHMMCAGQKGQDSCMVSTLRFLMENDKKDRIFWSQLQYLV